MKNEGLARKMSRQLSNRIMETSDTFQRFAALGLGSSVIIIVAVISLTTTNNPTKVANADEPRTNSRIVKTNQLKLNRFCSFNTVRNIDEKVHMNLVASVVAETIPRSALKERYQFISSLDDGAFGRVFKAMDRLTSKEVAIKVVPHRNMSADQVFNEVDVLRRVRGHENILHLFQVLNCEKKYFLISELCAGGELLEVLSETSVFNENRASRMVEKLASALQHIHKCGFAHCDLKPENIVFVDKNYDEMNCKVIDFGVSQELNSGTFELTEDNVESCVGTLAYSPPEILYLTKKLDKKEYKYNLEHYDLRKIDTWSLGIVLYISLFGCHPFDVKGEGDEEALMNRVLNNELSFDIHGPEFKVSNSAKDLITKLLHPDVTKRLTAEEVLNHKWVKKLKKEEYLSRLPNSWVHGGFLGGRTDEDEKTLKEERFNSFITEKSSDGFVRGLLIAALLNSNNSETEVHLSSDDFIAQAFKIIDKDKNGLISMKNIEDILQQTSSVADDEDQSVSPEVINFDDFKMLLTNVGCVSRKLKKGQLLFSEGSEPQGFYILTKGNCALEFEGRVFHVSKPGALFGESALQQNLEQRAVTVKALENSEVTYIPKQLFFRALAGSSALQTKLFEASRLQQARRVRGLIKRLIAETGDKLEKRKYKSGEYLYHVGEEPKNLFFIESGLVAAIGQGVDKHDFAEGPLTMGVAQRGRNDVTGTSIFFQKGKRYCSVQCLSDVEVSVLSIDQIRKLMKKNKTLHFYLAAQARWRIEQWNLRIAEAERGLTEQQLLPILLSQDELTTKTDTKSLIDYAKAIQGMESHVYEAGEAVFKKGEETDKFFVLNSGTAVAEFESEAGEVMVVAQFQPGDHFGERGLLTDRKTHGTSVRCVVPCEVLSMSRSKFFELMEKEDSRFAKAIEKAARMRKHRWGKNILVLARSKAEEEEIKLQEKNIETDKLVRIQSDLKKRLLRKKHSHNSSFDEFSMTVPHEIFKPEEATETEVDVSIERVVLLKGDKLFQQGDVSNAVYYIHSGELAYSPNEQNITSPNKSLPWKGEVGQHFEEGDTLGLDSIGNEVHQRFSCVCKSEKCVISKIPNTTLEYLINNHEYISDNLKKHFERVAPLRDLERNLNANLETSPQEFSKRRKLVRFFSSFYTKSNEDSEPEELTRRQNVGNISFSRVMEELSKSE